MISTIVFDLGNVLIPFDYSPMIEKFNKLGDGLGNRFAELYKNNYEFHRDFERGKISRTDFVNTLLQRLNNKISGEEFCKIFSDIFSLNQNVIDLLPVLKRKYGLYLLSNTNEIHEEYGYRHYRFLKDFDKLFLSHEVGFVKPEKEIYEAVQKHTGKPSEEHLFVDDVQDYVEGAKSCGWNAIQFTGFDNLVKDFKNYGIIF